MEISGYGPSEGSSKSVGSDKSSSAVDLTKTFQSIMLVMAMQKEADPIIENLKMEMIPKADAFGDLPFRAYSTKKKGRNFYIIVPGEDTRYSLAKGGHPTNVGTQPAAVATALGIMKFSPDLILNAGTAGSRNEKIQVGDVVVSNGMVKFHDRNIPFDGYDEYGAGNYPTLKVPPELISQLDVKEGNISTGNSFIDSDQ